MGQKTVKISYEEVRSLGHESIGLLAIQPSWCRKYNLDWQKPLYITADEKSQNYFIDGWELEDAKKEKED